MADVSRLLEVGSREYIQWILKSVSSCWGGGGEMMGEGTVPHTCSLSAAMFCYFTAGVLQR